MDFLLSGLFLALAGNAAWFVIWRKQAAQHSALQQAQQNLSEQLAQTQREQISLQGKLGFEQQKLAEKNQQLSAIQQQLQELQQRLDASLEQAARVPAIQEQLSQTQANLQRTEQQHQQLQQTLMQREAQLAKLEEGRVKDQQHAREQIELLERNKQQLTQEFENLANKIFEQKNATFNEQSKNNLSALLNPFKDQLEGLRKKVDDVYVSESKDRASLKTQIEELHKLNKQITEEASALTRALRGEKKTQGNWGELVLETVLEKSGLRAGEEFVRESSQQGDEGQRLRPDVIINLPEGKHIIVDAKVSLNDYTDYVNAESDVEREASLKRHVEAIRNHIRRLSDKAYQKLPNLNSPDFVFMFMPVEPAFMLAFQSDEKLFNDAFDQRIVVVTPTTLLATLRTVSSLWSIERQNRHAKLLADQAASVYDRLRIFTEKMEKLGAQINTAHNTYQDAWGSLKEGRGNLVGQAQKFIELGVRVKKELPKSLIGDSELSLPEDISAE
ncbi:MAG: DNA recombination protein RmuC [Oceanospirillaceae bacterium]|nr:DNA recombination protein RmuC [Oceanospirillaceae bacterium]MCP5349753.1 DNA recombination protein RmuC [Oceanospirillaceae bacterium]